MWKKIENKLIQIFDQIIIVVIPIVTLIWIIGLMVEAVKNIQSENYLFFINYAHLSLTLFGFTLIGSIFEKKTDTKLPIVKRLSHLAIVFLASSTSFLILYSYSFLLGKNILGPLEFYFLLGLFLIGYLGMVHGLIFLLITLYKYIRNL